VSTPRNWIHARESIISALSAPLPSLITIRTVPSYAHSEEGFIETFFDFCADNEENLKFTIDLLMDFSTQPRDDDQLIAHVVSTLKNTSDFKLERTSTLLIYYWSLFKPFVGEAGLKGGMLSKNTDVLESISGATLAKFAKGLSTATDVSGEYGGSIAKGAHKLGKVALKKIREKKYIPSDLLFERYPPRLVDALWVFTPIAMDCRLSRRRASARSCTARRFSRS
jgi:hypothetical protein